MKKQWMNKDLVKDICTSVSSVLGSAAVVSLAEGLRPGKDKGADGEEFKRLLRNVLIAVGAVVVICGAVYAVIRFVQSRRNRSSFLHREAQDCDGEEGFMEDPDIAGEFE